MDGEGVEGSWREGLGGERLEYKIKKDDKNV